MINRADLKTESSARGLRPAALLRIGVDDRFMAAQSRINGCLLLPEGGFPVWGNNSNLITWIRSRQVIDQKRPYQVNKAIDLDKDTSPQRRLVVVTQWFKLALPFFSRRPGRLWRCCLAGWTLVNVYVRQWFSCSGVNELWSESHNGADGQPVSSLLDGRCCGCISI